MHCSRGLDSSSTINLCRDFLSLYLSPVSAVMKAMRVGLNALAEGSELPQEFLSNKKELESIVRSASEGSCVWPDRLNAGWREAG